MIKNLLILLFFITNSSVLLAAGMSAKFINYYEIITHNLHINAMWESMIGSIFVSVFLLLVGLSFKSSVAKDDDNATPSGRFSMRFIIEKILDLVYTLCKDNCGNKYRNYFALLSTVFLFILFANLSGLIPGFPPPTETLNNNVAIGLVIFLVYNYAGIKEHGLSYIKHFLGPVAFIAPLYFGIELISHGSRPLSLGIRLMGNIMGDHMLLSVFTGLTKVVLPSFLMFFGLLVAVLQSFIFTLLSSLYISMSISHDH